MGDGQGLTTCEDTSSTLDLGSEPAAPALACSASDLQPAFAPSDVMSWIVPQLTPSTNMLTFAPTEIAKTQSMTFSVENTLQFPVEIVDATITPGDAALAFAAVGLTSGNPIPAGDRREIIVMFKPVDVGTLVGTLWLVGEGDVPLASIQLQGSGIAPPPPPRVPGARWEDIDVRRTPPYIMGSPPFAPIAAPPRPPTYVPKPLPGLSAPATSAPTSFGVAFSPLLPSLRPLPDECYPPYYLSPLEDALLCDRVGPPIPTKTKQAAEAQRAATEAATQWNATAIASIDAATKYLYDNWTSYYSKTSSSPRISRASLPDPARLDALLRAGFGGMATDLPTLGVYQPPQVPGTSLAHALGSNAFGNFFTDEAVQKRVAGWIRRNITKSVVKHGSAAVVGGAAGATVGGPVGWAVGFAIGVLIETAAGLLFDWLVGGDDLTPLLRAAYEQGWREASDTMGRLILGKSAELEGARITAKEALLAQKTMVDSAIAGANRVDTLDSYAEQLRQWAAGAVWTAPPGTAIADMLLGLWLRDHAASPYGPAGQVNESQWRTAADYLAKLPDSGVEAIMGVWPALTRQPDLFIRQTSYEWETLGLAQAPSLARRMYELLAITPDEVAKLDDARAKEYARWAFARFDHLEFEWSTDDLSAEFLAGLPSTISGATTCPPDLVRVGCELNLEQGIGSVWTLSWLWTFEMRDGSVQYYKRTPKNRTWEWMPSQARYHVPGVHESEGEREVERLRGLGLTVLEEGDARNHVWLQTVFGADVATPRIEEADGTPHPIRVYRVVELLPNYDPPLPEGHDWPGVLQLKDLEPGGYSTFDDKPKPRRPHVSYTYSEITAPEQRWHPPFMLFRSGDVIIVVEFFYYTGPR